MKIITLTNDHTFASNCYIILSGDLFSVVDPSVSYQNAEQVIPELKKYRSGYVLLTHGHADHFWEIQSYVNVGCEVLITDRDAKIAADKNLNCAALFGEHLTYNGEYRVINDGQILKVGEVEFKVMQTPGHTEGSVCYIADGIAFTGDTLFANGGYGRFDLPSGNIVRLKESLNKLFALDENIKIYSGHGPETTLGETKSFFR